MTVPLPPRYATTLLRGGPVDVWCAEDMHAFGCARAAEMQERCAKVCEVGICGSRGMAGPSCCILENGHSGEHSYGVPVAKTKEQCATAIRNMEPK